MRPISGLDISLLLNKASLEARLCSCSNANMAEQGTTESPPWSPRRVPPAQLWGEGPPRFPGYRSGGATLPNNVEGTALALHARLFALAPESSGSAANAPAGGPRGLLAGQVPCS